MEKLSFKNYVNILNENEFLLDEIKQILSSYDEEDLQYLGTYILVTFFDYKEEELFDVVFDVEDILDIIKDLDVENYGVVLDLISYNPDLDNSEEDEDYIMIDFSSEPDEDEAYDYAVDGAISENYAKVFLSKKFKRIKKFFAKTKASLAKDKAKNRMNYIKKKAKIQRVLKMNKQFLKTYRKSRALAIKTKKHIVQHHKGIKLT